MTFHIPLQTLRYNISEMFRPYYCILELKKVTAISYSHIISITNHILIMSFCIIECFDNILVCSNYWKRLNDIIFLNVYGVQKWRLTQENKGVLGKLS
jgi:hypothetical protein